MMPNCLGAEDAVAVVEFQDICNKSNLRKLNGKTKRLEESTYRYRYGYTQFGLLPSLNGSAFARS
jgi:hypothetical protein